MHAREIALFEIPVYDACHVEPSRLRNRQITNYTLRPRWRV
jgi:hypothetical protein